jgi:alpha-glucosidase
MIRKFNSLIFFIFTCCFLATGVVFGQKTLNLFSPDKKILFEFEIHNGKPGYRVLYRGILLVDFSIMDIIFDGDSLSGGSRLDKSSALDSAEIYSLLTGRSSRVNDPFRQLNLFLKETKNPRRNVLVQVRAFNDGLAFRYVFSGADGDSLAIKREHSEFNITGNPLVHALVLPDFLSSHEGNYLHREYGRLPEDSLMDMPMLLEFPDHIFMAITESGLLDYAGMYLVKTKSGLVSNLSPLPSQPAFSVRTSLPAVSPWRVMLINDRVGRFLETNMITDLAPPCQLRDTAWIKPGKTTFPWWNGNVTADTLNAPGNNFVTQQYYIDFCARSKIGFHSVVEYGLHQWYQDDGINFMPGPNSNVLKPVPGLDMKQVCDYAHSLGVGIRVWVHWKALYPKLDSAFAIFEQWGISGMMVDFMDRDDQEMVNIQTEILRKAAMHHLHIQFHGAYKPTGLSRTFPNEFTREGTLNYEADKWDPKGVSPAHDLDIAFTRLIAGSTDYHLGGFRAVTPENFRAQYTRPLVLGTRCHMLAMYVVLDNANAMVCDYPQAYENQPGFNFIQTVPVTWDETRVLDGNPGQYLVIARRKNNTWWIGAINGDSARTIKINPVFPLTDHGAWKATIYQDELKSPFDPNRLLTKTFNLDPSGMLEIPMGPGGGFAIALEPH